MSNCMLNIFSAENKAYSNKLKLEIKSVKLLTNNILSETEKMKTGKLFSESQTVTRSVVINVSATITTDELYENINKYLKAIIQYFDSIEESHTLPAIIDTPTFCHLPTLCHMLWRRVQTLSKGHVESKECLIPFEQTESVSVSLKSTQTDTSSLVYCESCHLSTGLIKSLVHLILNSQKEHNIEETNVSKAREKIRNELYDMSQLGVMKLWTAAIQSDIEWLLSSTVAGLRKYNKTCQEQEVERRAHRRKETVLQNNLDLTRKQLEAEQAQCAYLKQQVENLNTSLARKTKKEKALLQDNYEHRNKLTTFGDLLTLIKDDCKQIKVFQKSLQAFTRCKMEYILRTFIHLKEDIDSNIKKNEHNFMELLQREKTKLREFEQISKEKEHEITELKINVQKLHQEKTELNEKMTIIDNQKNSKEVELRKVKDMVAELENLFEESRRTEKLRKLPLAENLKISGDPVTDMENQRQVNKQKIKYLLRENANLKATISKLKNIKSNI